MKNPFRLTERAGEAKLGFAMISTAKVPLTCD